MRLRKRHTVSDQEVGEVLEVSAPSCVWLADCGVGRQDAGLLRAVRSGVEEPAKCSFVASGQRVLVLAIERILHAELEGMCSFGPGHITAEVRFVRKVIVRAKALQGAESVPGNCRHPIARVGIRERWSNR